MAALGRVPTVDDTVSLPGWQLRVIRMEGRRVARVRFEAVSDEVEGLSGEGETQ